MVGFRSIFCRFLLRSENEAWRKGMSILTSLAIWTFPEPSKLLSFNGVYKKFTNDLQEMKDRRLYESRNLHRLLFVGCLLSRARPFVAFLRPNFPSYLDGQVHHEKHPRKKDVNAPLIFSSCSVSRSSSYKFFFSTFLPTFAS